MELQEERKTQLANEILMELLTTYKENQIRIFLATINKFLSKSYAYVKSCGISGDEPIDFYRDGDDGFQITVPLSFYKEYGIKKRYTQDEWEEIMESMIIPIRIKEGSETKIINIIDEVIFNRDKQQFTIIFDEKYIEYILLINRNNFSIIDLGDIKELNGKYQIGLYLLTRKYTKTGKAMFTMESIKKYFGKCGCSDKYILKEVREARDYMCWNLGYDINLNTIKKGRKVTNIEITFPRID